MNSKICFACGELFLTRPQNPTQTYCSKKACQLKRRGAWQKLKLQTDTDYRDNQMRAQKAWMKRNPDYWQKYRDTHPSNAEKDRVLQPHTNNTDGNDEIAKMDVSTCSSCPSAGIYFLMPCSKKKIAKMDVWTVELTLIGT
ncbi:hypothetical protein [Undibacterium sp. KW1]|uniref:hypothetical protein n=1 Tax=Undibacterium sp. KW1 TaxID=2058624 RepID=UPI00138A547E|nr:hypothetical protein [Undibacterium sp. KW1]